MTRACHAAAVLPVALLLLSSPGSHEAASATLPGAPEHPSPPPPGHHLSHSSDELAGGQRQAAAAPRGGAGGPFLTRPHLNRHAVTSVFDHCNPDYSHDGLVCDSDGIVARRSNGFDPGFP